MYLCLSRSKQANAVIAIDNEEVLEGSLPNNKLKLVVAWAEIHKEDLLANWKLTINGQPTVQIKPLELKMIKVTKVVPLKNGILNIYLSDGRSGLLDIKPYCTSDFFKELLNDEYLKKVSIFFRGIGWPNGQDLGPDTISCELKTNLDG